MVSCFFFLMIRRPPRSTRTDTLFPYTTLFRSCEMIRDIVTGDTTVSYERRSARSNPVLLRSFLRLIGASGFTGLGWVLPIVMAAALGLNAVLRLRSVTERSPIAVPFIAAVSVLLIGTTM